VETSLHTGAGRTTGENHALARNVQESVHKPHGASLSRDLRIAVIDKNPLRAAILEEGFRAAGHMSVVRIDDTEELLDRIRAIDPDVILIDLESPSRNFSNKCSW
jgi:hypothetical protein